MSEDRRFSVGPSLKKQILMVQYLHTGRNCYILHSIEIFLRFLLDTNSSGYLSDTFITVRE